MNESQLRVAIASLFQAPFRWRCQKTTNGSLRSAPCISATGLAPCILSLACNWSIVSLMVVPWMLRVWLFELTTCIWSAAQATHSSWGSWNRSSSPRGATVGCWHCHADIPGVRRNATVRISHWRLSKGFQSSLDIQIPAGICSYCVLYYYYW